jgi:hypothetical protein
MSSLQTSEFLFDSNIGLRIIDFMKQLKALLELLPRKTLAAMFACLFMLQGMGLFHAAFAADSKSQETVITSAFNGAQSVAAKSNHCDKMFNDSGLMGGHCSHIGFCPLCSVMGWGVEVLAKPAKTDVIEVISLRSLAQPPIVVEIDPALLQTSVGIERTYSIIAPPSA